MFLSLGTIGVGFGFNAPAITISGQETMPTNERGLAKWHLRNLLAECPSFQDAIGAVGSVDEKIAIAKLRLHRSAYAIEEEALKEYKRPFGLICSIGSDTSRGAGVREFLHGGEIELRLEKEIPQQYLNSAADAETDFENFYESVLDEAMELSGKPGYFAINSWQIIEGPTIYEIETNISIYGIRLMINWGLS